MDAPTSPPITLGKVVVTANVWHDFQERVGEAQALSLIAGALSRHRHGDWGVLCDQDAKANDDALVSGARLLSRYELSGRWVYVITEWDRSVTTVLFPEDY